MVGTSQASEVSAASQQLDPSEIDPTAPRRKTALVARALTRRADRTQWKT